MTETSNGQGERGITALFVRRPVLAFVINTLIAVAGMAAFYGVEIRELPDVDRPVITVTTDYTGASAETIDRELTAVLEGAVSRVSGVKAISSTSSTCRFFPTPFSRRAGRRVRTSSEAWMSNSIVRSSLRWRGDTPPLAVNSAVTSWTSIPSICLAFASRRASTCCIDRMEQRS